MKNWDADSSRIKGVMIMADDKADLNYLNYQVKHGVPLEKALRNLGYEHIKRFAEARDIIANLTVRPYKTKGRALNFLTETREEEDGKRS